MKSPVYESKQYRELSMNDCGVKHRFPTDKSFDILLVFVFTIEFHYMWGYKL